MAGWNVNGVEFERPAGQRGAVFVYDGELWDTAEHGLFCTELTVGSPEVRQNKREALARDGFIDLTEQFGRPVFGNRTISWRFLVTEEDWQTRCAEVRELIADLHGREVDILVDDYEGWTFTGRLALERVTHQLDGTYIEVTADCEPFRSDGSVYSLDASAATIDLGPDDFIEPDVDIGDHLANPETYHMTIESPGDGYLANGYVFASSGSLLMMLDSVRGPRFDRRVRASDVGRPVAGVEYTVSLDDSGRLAIPAAGADVYAYVYMTDAPVGTPVPTDLSIGKLSASGEWLPLTDETFGPVGVFLLDSFGEYSGGGNRGLNYELKFTAPATTFDFTVGLYLYAVPQGSQAPTSSDMTDTSKNKPGRIAFIGYRDTSAGEMLEPNVTYPVTTVARPYILTEYGKFYPTGSTTGHDVTLNVRLQASGAAIQNLSELGHRFFRLTGTIPPTDNPSDPEYIDIDGRRYYADEEEYTIRVNAGYRSRVVIYGEGPRLTAEGLAI